MPHNGWTGKNALYVHVHAGCMLPWLWAIIWRYAATPGDRIVLVEIFIFSSVEQRATLQLGMAMQIHLASIAAVVLEHLNES